MKLKMGKATLVFIVVSAGLLAWAIWGKPYITTEEVKVSGIVASVEHLERFESISLFGNPEIGIPPKSGTIRATKAQIQDLKIGGVYTFSIRTMSKGCGPIFYLISFEQYPN